MSKSKIILLSGSLVWVADGVETERIPMKSEYDIIINCYDGIYDGIYDDKNVKMFDPLDGLSDKCNFAMCSGISEEQVCDDIAKILDTHYCPDLTKQLVHAFINMHSDFYDEYCRKAEEAENQLGI